MAGLGGRSAPFPGLSPCRLQMEQVCHKALVSRTRGPSRTATWERACMECVHARELWAHPAHGQGRLAWTGPSARSREQQESGGLAGPWRWLSHASKPRPHLPNTRHSQKLRGVGGSPQMMEGGGPLFALQGQLPFLPRSLHSSGGAHPMAPLAPGPGWCPAWPCPKFALGSICWINAPPSKPRLTVPLHHHVPHVDSTFTPFSSKRTSGCPPSQGEGRITGL